MFGGQTVQSPTQGSPGSQPGFPSAIARDKGYYLVHIHNWWVHLNRSHKWALIFHQASALLAGLHYRLGSEFGSKQNIDTYNFHNHKEKACTESTIPQFLDKTWLRRVAALSKGKNVRLKPKNWSEPRTSLCHSGYNKLWNTVQGKTKSHLNK